MSERFSAPEIARRTPVALTITESRGQSKDLE